MTQPNFVHVNGIRLEYADWGGDGPPLVFLAGMGCTAHIFDRFAPRFTDRFHAVGMTRRGHGESDYPESGYDVDTLTEDLRQFLDALEIDHAILIGHSLAGIEIGRFAACYPKRVKKIVYLDAAFDRRQFVDINALNPLEGIWPPEPEGDYYIMDDLIAFYKRVYPTFAELDELFDADFRRNYQKDRKGKVVDKMGPSIALALRNMADTYAPEYDRYPGPVLALYLDWEHIPVPTYLPKHQQQQFIDFWREVRVPLNRESLDQLRQEAPNVEIVQIPTANHYLFVTAEDQVYQIVRDFLLKE